MPTFGILSVCTNNLPVGVIASELTLTSSSTVVILVAGADSVQPSCSAHINTLKVLLHTKLLTHAF